MPPRVDYYRVSIKRVPAPTNTPAAPAGLSSNFFHDHIQEGSRLSVKAPSGHFHLMEKEPLPMVLIGGGIGVTPMLSILNTVLESGIEREVWLYYGVHNRKDHIMKEQLQALASRHKNFHLYVCYSAPRNSDVEGIDYQHRGQVDITLLQTTLTMQLYQFYVCGPKAMMESMIPALLAWGMYLLRVLWPRHTDQTRKSGRENHSHATGHGHLQPFWQKHPLGSHGRFTAGVC